MNLEKSPQRPSKFLPPGPPQRGGVAMEYILVTTFTLATTLAALGYLKRVLKERFAELEEAGQTTEFNESLWRP